MKLSLRTLTYPLRFLAANMRRHYSLSSYPFLMNYNVTFRCNLSCRTCGMAERPSIPAELTVQEVSTLLSDPFLRKLAVLVVSGGEPFIREDIAPLIGAFSRLSSLACIHITTNGYYSDRIIDTLHYLLSRDMRIHLKVSIDGDAETHTKIRGKSTSYENAVNTISRLTKERERRKLFIAINQTITAQNLHTIPFVRALARDLGVEYRGFLGVEKPPLFTGRNDIDYSLVPFSEEEKVYLKKELFNKRKKHAVNIIEDLVLDHYLNGQRKMLMGMMPRHRCMNLFSHIRMNPNGDIITCGYDTERIGNIRDQSLATLLESPYALRKKAMVKSCGKCWFGCEVTPNWISSLFTF